MTERRRGQWQDHSSEQLKRSVVEHYERQFERYGATARGMDWKDEASQKLRFATLCEVCDLNGKSLHEIGAGAQLPQARLRSVNIYST